MSALRLALAFAASLPFLSSPSAAQDSESAFHHAYFLEKERGHLQEALALYEQVVQSQQASAGLRAQAEARAAGLREDLASVDLARLMPGDALLYAELSRPGDALLRVLERLGLTGSFQEAAARGGFALKPEMVRELFGIRGLALALTRLPVDGGQPSGVLVLHTGELEALRGLLESAVLARGLPQEPIEATPAWSIEGMHVALSARLVVAGTGRDDVAQVLRRLAGKEQESLATRASPALRAHLEQRGNDPLFLCVNAVPLRPMLATLLAQQAQGDARAALLGAALDPQSLQAFVARLSVGDDGLALEADLYLEEDHRNLAFNLLRGARLDPVLLERIPAGVAAFVAGAFSERGPAIAPLERNAKGAPVVTAMDFGRELFANLAGFALYVLPGGAPIPSAALVVSSNDPARTGALLGFLLGFGNALATGGTLEGRPSEIGGAPTVVYRLPPGLPLYVTTHENTVLVSPSEELIEQALESRASGESVLHDEAFAGELGRLGKDTTLALCAHLGRTLAVAEPYLPAEPRAHLAKLAPVLARTVLALQTRHGQSRLGLGLAVHGLPRIDGLVAELLERERAGASLAETRAGLLPRFEQLAASEGEEAARAFAHQQLEVLADDPRALNNFAWELLTEERHGQRFDDVALEAARRANRASGNAVWQYLDTQALAEFRAGNVQVAIALAEQALARAQSAADRGEVQAALARFRKAAGQTVADEDSLR